MRRRDLGDSTGNAVKRQETTEAGKDAGAAAKDTGKAAVQGTKHAAQKTAQVTKDAANEATRLSRNVTVRRTCYGDTLLEKLMCNKKQMRAYQLP